MATEAPLPTSFEVQHEQIPSSRPLNSSIHSPVSSLNTNPSEPQVLTTVYSWPTLEPLRFEYYPTQYLKLPLRRDILHRAVIYEGDKTRQGTANTKWRGDVRGSRKKIRPQKGTGRARLGDKKSPMLRGGGVAHGPHPRDFSTGLQRKVYDLAWRTALSYRYKMGQLIVVDNKIALERHTGVRLLENIFAGNGWGNKEGRSTLVTTAWREKLFREMAEIGRHGVVKDMYDVDVKDLLKTGRVIIEKQALDTILLAHISDLGPRNSMEYAAKLVRKSLPAGTVEEELDDEEDMDDEEVDGETTRDDEFEDLGDDSSPLTEEELAAWEKNIARNKAGAGQ